MPVNTLFVNATIYPLEEGDASFGAMWVRDGSIIGLGTAAELRSQMGQGKVVDLEGATVLPSFTDAHIHFLHYGLGLRRLQLEGCSLQETLAKVSTGVTGLSAGQWLVGRGFDCNLWDCGWPKGEWLDAISEEHPIVLIAKDGHMVWLNQAAFAALGIDSNTPNPKGGIIERNEHGAPSGLCKETAADFVVQHLPAASEEQRLNALRGAVKEAHRLGITAVHTMEDRQTWSTWQQLRHCDALRMRGVLQVPSGELDAVLSIGMQSGFGDQYLRFGGIKIFADGSLGSRTAWMLEPYQGENHKGVIVTEAEELADLIGRANRGGITAAVHAIGDGATRAVLDAVAEQGIPSLRNRLEHAQLLAPEDIPRLAQLGIVASMQPTQCPMDRYMAEQYWGERCAGIYAFRSLLNVGTLLAFGSDAPVESPNVLLGLYSAVARKQWQEPDTAPWRQTEAISMVEALQAYTVGAATAVDEQHYRGTLAPGQRADFVLLSEDILAATTEDPIQGAEILKETKIQGTFFEGQPVYLP